MDSREAIPAVGVFTLVSALGFDEGGYAATAWGWSSVVLLAVLAVLSTLPQASKFECNRNAQMQAVE